MAPDGPPARANPARGLALIATAVIIGIFVLQQGFDTDTDPAAEAAGNGGTTDETADGGATEETDPAADGDAEDGGGDAGGDGGEGANGGEGGDGGDGGDDAAPREPAEVAVRVANTTQVGGAAGSLTSEIETNGYQTNEATDAAERDRSETVIYFREGYEQEALALSNAVAPEGTAVEVEAVPEDPPLDRDNNEALMTGDTHLLVLLGSDLAGGA